MTISNIRWGVLGAGAIAHRFVRDLVHVPGASLTAVYARRPKQGRELASVASARVVDTPEALFTSGIDAVYIATHPDTHHNFARAALSAGLPVLCEKPVTRSLAELDDLLTLAAVRDLLFMEAMKSPFLPLYRALRAHLAPGPSTVPAASGDPLPHIGPIQFVQAGNAVAHVARDHPSRSAALAGGALLAVGVYQAFLAVDWLGPVSDLQALTRPSSDPVDTFTLLQCRHTRGLSQLYAGLELASPGTATLSGPSGFVTLHRPHWTPSRATITPTTGPAVDLSFPVIGDGLHYETAHFCDLLRSGSKQSPIVLHAHSRAVIHLLDLARSQIGLSFPGEFA